MKTSEESSGSATWDCKSSLPTAHIATLLAKPEARYEDSQARCDPTTKQQTPSIQKACPLQIHAKNDRLQKMLIEAD
jgi:hypothetical protein